MTTFAITSKTESVMDIAALDTVHAVFNNQDPDGPPPDRSVAIPKALWLEMGAPTTITMTIVPGDTLNVAPDDASALVACDHRFDPKDKCLDCGTVRA